MSIVLFPYNEKAYQNAVRMMQAEGRAVCEAPDCIILDEFHHCGAGSWDRGVDELLEVFPEAEVLGQSL